RFFQQAQPGSDQRAPQADALPHRRDPERAQPAQRSPDMREAIADHLPARCFEHDARIRALESGVDVLGGAQAQTPGKLVAPEPLESIAVDLAHDLAVGRFHRPGDVREKALAAAPDQVCTSEKRSRELGIEKAGFPYSPLPTPYFPFSVSR